MKLQKILPLLLVLLMSIFSYSCARHTNNGGNAATTNSSTAVKEKPSKEDNKNESVEKKDPETAKLTLDSLNRRIAELEGRTANNTNELAILKKSTSDNYKKLNSKEKTLDFKVASLFIVCVVLLILVIILFVKQYHKSNKSSYTYEDQLNKQIADIESRLNKLQQQGHDIPKLKTELNNIKRRLDNLTQLHTDHGINPVPPLPPIPTTGININGYFGVPVKSGSGYFRNLIEKMGPNVRFTVELQGNNIALFEPMKIIQFKSDNNLDIAIDYVGSKNGAQHADVLKPGKAILEGDKWIIVEKAIVKPY